MSKHTPGPWRVVEHSWSDTGIYAKQHAIAGLSIEGIADETNQSQLEAEMAANAKLIAAAPEMLEVLGDLEMLFDEQTYDDLVKAEFDTPDDREFTVNISAKQLRAISQALQKAGA